MNAAIHRFPTAGSERRVSQAPAPAQTFATFDSDRTSELMEDEKDDRDVQAEEVKNIIVISEPDDIAGERYRIWVKVRR